MNKIKKLEEVNYSSEVLHEFEILILQKIEVTRSEYENIVQELKVVQENSTVSSLTEDIPGTIMFDEMKILARRQKEYLDNLNNALLRIKNGTYGVCRATGKLIPVERLRAVPTATVCVEAKNIRKIA